MPEFQIYYLNFKILPAMITFLIILILSVIFSFSEKSNKNTKTKEVYLFYEVCLKSKNNNLWKVQPGKVIEEMNLHKENKMYVTFQINDTIFNIIEEVPDLSMFQKKTGPGIYDYLGIEYLNLIHHVKSGLLVLDNKFTPLNPKNLKDEGLHAHFEMCHIKPDKIIQTEENWLQWGVLNDSLQTGNKYFIFRGLIGFDNPFYLVLAYAPDSTAMKNSMKILWTKGKEKADELLQKELPNYRDIKIYSGTLVPELSHWPLE
jgi:hypothetical protein